MQKTKKATKDRGFNKDNNLTAYGYVHIPFFILLFFHIQVDMKNYFFVVISKLLCKTNFS